MKKGKIDRTKENMGKKPLFKYVKKANMWCMTYWVDGKQQQDWFLERPDEIISIHDS